MSGKIPSLNWLRVFEAAARTASFAVAARELNMTASAVSQQIRALEGHLGAPLFLRGARSVALTDAGRAFLPSVQNSLIAVETTAGALFGDRGQSVLTVQVVTVFALSWLAPRLSGFRDRHPAVRLDVSTGNRTEDFIGTSADLKIFFGSGPIGDPVEEALCGEWLYPVAIPSIGEQIGSPGDVLGWPLIDVSSHRNGWPQVLAAAGVTGAATRLTYVDNTPLAFAIAATGAGIALGRAPITDRLAGQLGLVPCLPDLAPVENHGYRLAHAGLDVLTPAARDFRSWVLKELAG